MLSRVGWSAVLTIVSILSAPHPARAQEFTVETNLPAEGYVPRDASIELRFSRQLGPTERVALFIGSTDVSDLARSTPEGMRYTPQVTSLPSGESELTVYLVGAGGTWEEIARFPLQVVGRLGFETARVTPSLDLEMTGQLAEGHDPPDNGPLRSTYQELTGQLNLGTELVRGSFRSVTRANIMGVSYQNNALRFGDEGEDAPKIDLSDYQIQLGLGVSDLSVGHVSMGRQRHLISGFGSRGAVLGLKPGSRLDVSVGALSGSSIVGWDNLLGIFDPDHRIVSGTLGLEVLDRPGGLRLEVSAMDGSILPLGGFNQGVVNDAEESRGVSVRVQASDPTQRVQLEAGFARSTFTNPEDPELAQGEELVPVSEETNNARYLEAGVNVLRSVPLGATRTASLSVAYRHERVDPLYRSLGAYARADNSANTWEMRGRVAEIGFSATHGRSEDNLDAVPSILKTKTRRTGINLAFPLANIVGTAASVSRWLPALGYAFDRTHQFGDGIPENGGFDPSHIPDQVSRSQSATLDWQWNWLVFGYRLNHSKQDNRQPGREDADFTTLTNGVTVGLTPLATLQLDLTLEFERAKNEQFDETDNTRRYGVGVNWNPIQQSTLSFSLSNTRSSDAADTRERKDTVINVGWSSFVPGLDRFGGQYTLRFSGTISESAERTFDVNERFENWSVNSGLNFSFF